MIRKLITSIIVVLLTTFATKAANPDKILGIWLTQDKDSKVEIIKKDNLYYGRIIWLKEPLENGLPILDKNNPSDKLKSRQVIGLNILNKLVFDKNEWNNGEIYDPKKGKTYDCLLWFDKENESILHLKGYIGFSLIGREVSWTRSNK